jgi:hypothetical protein
VKKETKAQSLLQAVAIRNPNPDALAKVGELTDELPINQQDIEDEIALLKSILHKNDNHLGIGSHIQGMANIGVIKWSN